LEFRQKAKGRHARVGIAATDLPKQRAICLRLHVGVRELWRLTRAAPVVSVAFSATLAKQFFSTGNQLRSTRERIHFCAGLDWRDPCRVSLANIQIL
jgi:hypothetical protein